MKIVILSRRLLNFLLLVVIILTATLTGCANSEVVTTSAYTASSSPTSTSMPTTTYLSPVQRKLQSEGLIGDKLLFITQHDITKPGLYIINIDGTQMTKLAEGGWSGDINEICWYFSLSPDKKLLAYFSTTANNNTMALNILNLNDYSVTRVIEVEGGNVAWSPDGSRIAYVNLAGYLHVVNIDGTDDRELSSPNSQYYLQSGQVKGHITHPVWSPDGKYIMFDDFNARHTMTVGSVLENTSVYLLNLDTGDTNIVQSEAEIINSPTGGPKVLLHTVYHCFDVNGDGTALRELNLDFNDKVQYSPDGSLIAYFSWGDPLEVLDAATGSLAYHTHVTELDHFVWSPDSKHIAYVLYTQYDTVSDVYIVRNDLSQGFRAFSQLDTKIVFVGWLK